MGVPTPNPVIPPSYGATPIGVPATQSQGLILSPALEPIPARLVGRIASGQFVEMRDLLSDNIALHDQLEAVQGMHYAPNSVRPRLREVPSLTSWVFCCTVYIATRTTDPLTRDMLAYCRLIIREALRHGGTGWQEYDRNFRRQVAINPAIAWNTMLPDLQATTMLGQREGGGTFCHLCMGMDHSASHCALTYTRQQTIPPPSAWVPPASRRSVPRYTGSLRPETLLRICASWNMGQCSYPGSCTYRHICFTCQHGHRAQDCPDTPEDSPYKRHRRPPAVLTAPPRATTAASRATTAASR